VLGGGGRGVDGKVAKAAVPIGFAG